MTMITNSSSVPWKFLAWYLQKQKNFYKSFPLLEWEKLPGLAGKVRVQDLFYFLRKKKKN
jgi:hypothetical protein